MEDEAGFRLQAFRSDLGKQVTLSRLDIVDKDVHIDVCILALALGRQHAAGSADEDLRVCLPEFVERGGGRGEARCGVRCYAYVHRRTAGKIAFVQAFMKTPEIGVFALLLSSVST